MDRTKTAAVGPESPPVDAPQELRRLDSRWIEQRAVRAFQLGVMQDEAGNPRPGVLLELDEGVNVDEALRADRALHIRNAVAALNRD